MKYFHIQFYSNSKKKSFEMDVFARSLAEMKIDFKEKFPHSELMQVVELPYVVTSNLPDVNTEIGFNKKVIQIKK